MRIHAIQTGTVAIKQRQVQGTGQRFLRKCIFVLPHTEGCGMWWIDQRERRSHSVSAARVSTHEFLVPV